ncbi:hypothetical protein [Paraliomyxa miuraensis]|uniref:hypothetical protein n=1 Tax=Paraliomyxa miuraensis TaxID=376150 RepID=UPI002250ADCB|nr:hypothetical protein [Paraliomyxa miuraensis]MCX4243201.1 hypothetical protein [Paraliomyxa miuraensis]
MHRRFVHLLNSLAPKAEAPAMPVAGPRVAGAACLVLAMAASMALPANAHAGKYDLDLTPLGSLETQGGGTRIVQDNAAFRSLSSELGTIMAPKVVDPADSLGLSGFAISADVSINTLSSNQNYWQATSGADTAAPSMQIMGRKGLWPGVEVGGGATHLFDSRMWALGGYGKIAFHEGFHHLPIPSIAIRGSFSRLLGAKDFNMTTAAPAVTVSHLFGLGKTFSLTPYVGYEALIIFSRSQVLNANPSCDEFPDAYNEDPDACDFPDGMGGTVNKPPSEFVFADGGAIVRHRPHFGARIIFSVIRIGLEAMFVPGGKSEGTVDGETVVDGSGLQQQYTVSVGLDF